MKTFERSPQPVVFMFQPTRFEIVEGERLKKWEENLRHRVGLFLNIDDLANHLEGTGTCCESHCPDADDCDQD